MTIEYTEDRSLDTDNTLGGDSPSDIKSPSQKAVNTFVKNETAKKQDILVSGSNIKSINNESILGSGNIDIQGGGTVTVDSALSTTSENPVQNKVITTEVNKKLENTATGTGSLTIGGTANDRTAATNVGASSVASANNTVALGYNAQATSPYSTTIGRNSKTSGASAIQIGYGTNSTANTLSVGFYNTSSTHYNWQLLDGTTGLIPTARIDTDTTATSGSAKPITSGAVYTILGDIETLINAL